MIGLPERQDRICIVNDSGSIVSYHGTSLRFDACDRERAEMILELLGRNGHGGPFRIVPLIGESR